MQKTFKIKRGRSIIGFVSFGGNSQDRRKAARAHQAKLSKASPVTVERVRGNTSTVPVKHFVHESALVGNWAHDL